MVLVLHTFIDNAEFSYRTIKGYPAFSYSATSFCLVSTFLLGIYIYIYIYISYQNIQNIQYRVRHNN